MALYEGSIEFTCKCRVDGKDSEIPFSIVFYTDLYEGNLIRGPIYIPGSGFKITDYRTFKGVRDFLGESKRVYASAAIRAIDEIYDYLAKKKGYKVDRDENKIVGDFNAFIF